MNKYIEKVFDMCFESFQKERNKCLDHNILINRLRYYNSITNRLLQEQKEYYESKGK